MYVFVWKPTYSKELRAEIFATLAEALEEAEKERMLRRNYGVTWWIATPMERTERFYTDNKVHQPAWTPDPGTDGDA